MGEAGGDGVILVDRVRLTQLRLVLLAGLMVTMAGASVPVRSLSELSPEQLVHLAMGANLEGRQMTAAQERLQERCAPYQQRVIARQSAGGGIRSLFTAQGYLDRWGRERVAGAGTARTGQ